MSKKEKWAGQKILFYTTHFGKDYVWLEDGDGTCYMVRVDENGYPQFA